MKIRFVVITLTLFLIVGHIPLVESFPRHPQYFKRYFQKFDVYFRTNFFDVSKIRNQKKFQKKMREVSHWREKGGQRIFSWDFIFHEKTGELSYSFSFGDEVKDTIYLKKFNEKLEGFPLTQKGKFIFSSFVEEARVHKSSSGEIHRVDFFLNDVQVEWLPDPLKRAIYKIGYDTRLPADKISITKTGEIYVRYP